MVMWKWTIRILPKTLLLLSFCNSSNRLSCLQPLSAWTLTSPRQCPGSIVLCQDAVANATNEGETSFRRWRSCGSSSSSDRIGEGRVGFDPRIIGVVILNMPNRVQLSYIGVLGMILVWVK